MAAELIPPIHSMHCGAESAGNESSAAPAARLVWGDLPPALVTGHQLIDFEHRHLLGCITSLRRVCDDQLGRHQCGDCGEAKRNRCEGNLVGMLGDLLAFILDHFKTEEGIMRDSLLLMVDRDLCEAHMEDHAAISGKVQEIVAALDPMKTVSLIRDLDGLLLRWITHHIALHDMLLARWVDREESILRPVRPPAG